jgi:hypothetical protein
MDNSIIIIVIVLVFISSSIVSSSIGGGAGWFFWDDLFGEPPAPGIVDDSTSTNKDDKNIVTSGILGGSGSVGSRSGGGGGSGGSGDGSSESGNFEDKTIRNSNNPDSCLQAIVGMGSMGDMEVAYFECSNDNSSKWSLKNNILRNKERDQCLAIKGEGMLTTKPCNENDTLQQWNFNSSSQQLKNNLYKTCLTAPTKSNNESKSLLGSLLSLLVKTAKCDNKNEQKWYLGN